MLFRDSEDLAGVGATDCDTGSQSLHTDELVFLREGAVNETRFVGNVFPIGR